MTSPSNAPTREIGYAQPHMASVATSSNWWMFDDETTPELRWPQSVYVYDQMRRTDAQVTSVLRAVTLPVRRTPWRLDPAGARDEVVQLVAEDLGLPIVGLDPKPLPRARDRFSWLEHLREALLMLPFGHMYFEQNVRIVEGKARLRKLAARMPKTIEEIDVARDGGLVSIKQYSVDSVRQPAIPVGRLVAYVNEKEGGDWLGRSLLRSCYKNWLIKDRLLRVQAQTIERNGMGVPLYTAPPNATATDIATGADMAQRWRSGEDAGSAIPNEAKMQLLGVEGTLPDADPAIRYHDEQIARAVLAHFLNLGTQTGSWALGTTFADFFTLSLQTLAQQVADVATQHVVEDLVDWNWGEDEPAPKIVFDEIGSRQAATAEAIRSLIDAGVITPDEVLEGAVRQQFGLPPKDPNADPVPVQPAEAPVEASGAGPKGVTAKFNPHQPRDPGGDDGGQWVKGPGVGADVTPGDGGKRRSRLPKWLSPKSKTRQPKPADTRSEEVAARPVDPRVAGSRREFSERVSRAATGSRALAATPAKFSFDVKENPDGTLSYRGAGKIEGPKGLGSSAVLEAYVSTDDHVTINEFSRGLMFGQTRPGEIPKGRTEGDLAGIVGQIEEIDKTMSVSPLEEDAVVYRVVRNGAQMFGTVFDTGEDIGNDLGKLQQIQRKRATGWRPDATGMKFTDHGFSSTSANDVWVRKWASQWQEPGDEPVLLRMLVPKGTGGVQLSGEDSGEQEILLERGLSWGVVEDHGLGPDGLRRLDVMPVAR